jgi:hypothetical protein
MSSKINLRRCSTCKNEKMTSEFHSNKSQKDYYSNQFKECNNIYTDMYHPKVTCIYGKTIQKYYLNHHLQTRTHNSKLSNHSVRLILF